MVRSLSQRHPGRGGVRVVDISGEPVYALRECGYGGPVNYPCPVHGKSRIIAVATHTRNEAGEIPITKVRRVHLA